MANPNPRPPDGEALTRRGLTGADGRDHSSEIAMLKAQVEQLVKELQTQLTRIGQLQAQLDRVESGRRAEPQNRRSSDRTEH